MVTQLPEQLKKHDLGRFALRAAQLDKLKPVVAYWCYYWILKQIISKGLEKSDAECASYAGSLMDHVELIKTEHPSEDALNDDVAAQLYVEQFGLETFNRGDKAIQGNHVTKQTADTLQAAATFLEIVQIWNPPSQELATKIKYAKFHALRIVKAIRVGDDPNLSNPPPPSDPDVDAPAADIPLDPNDPEVQAINRAAGRQPSIADAPDADAPTSSLSVAPSAPHLDEGVSPIDPGDVHNTQELSSPALDAMTPQGADSQPGSIGGGYFPEIPSAPDSQPGAPAETSHVTPPNTTNPDATENFYAASPPPHAHPAPAPPVPTQPTARTLTARPLAPTPAPANAQHAPSGGPPDDVAIAAAQKHARWAISALNFEDVPTAIRELQYAIAQLGGS